MAMTNISNIGMAIKKRLFLININVKNQSYFEIRLNSWKSIE